MNFQRNHFLHRKKESSKNFPNIWLNYILFFLFFLRRSLLYLVKIMDGKQNKLCMIWMEWNEKYTNEIPLNLVAGILFFLFRKNAIRVLSWSSPFFALRLINRYRLLSNWYLNTSNPNVILLHFFFHLKLRYSNSNDIRFSVCLRHFSFSCLLYKDMMRL